MKRFISAVMAALALAGAAVLLIACGDTATLPLAAGIGPQPQLPSPRHTFIPTVNIAPAVGWTGGSRPTAATGLAVVAFATGLAHPRNIYVLPNGDILVAESNAPPKPDDSTGLRGFVMRQIMARAGAGVPSANRMTLLRDTNGTGVADMRTTFLEGLHSTLWHRAGWRSAFCGRYRYNPPIPLPDRPDPHE